MPKIHNFSNFYYLHSFPFLTIGTFNKKFKILCKLIRPVKNYEGVTDWETQNEKCSVFDFGTLTIKINFECFSQ